MKKKIMGYTHPMIKLKNIIELKMKEKGLNVNSLTIRAGLKDSVIKNILYDKSINPRVDTLCKIADALECSLDELCGREKLAKIDNHDLWIKSIERVDELIAKTGKVLSSSIRAELYLGCYELNMLNLEIKDESQFNVILKFINNKH